MPQELHAAIVKCLGRAVFDADGMSAVATALWRPSWKRVGLFFFDGFIFEFVLILFGAAGGRGLAVLLLIRLLLMCLTN